MSLHLDEVSIRCMGCREHNTLEGSIADEWRICDHCQFFICRFCMENLGDSRYCLSYACRRDNRHLELGPIPVERVLLFARSQQATRGRKGLLHRLFFAGGDLDLPFVLRESDEAGSPLAGEEVEERPTTIQEEVWRNHSLVVTKRRGGKFITWEKLS